MVDPENRRLENSAAGPCGDHRADHDQRHADRGFSRSKLAFGVALFICSDILLALQMFVLRKAVQRPGLGRLEWLCYGSARALILRGAVGAGETWVLQSTG